MAQFWYHPTPLQRKAALWKWYEMIAVEYAEVGLPFMNYGFVETDPGAAPIPLEPSDEKYRLGIQLYHQTAGAVDLQGKTVLEVGSGRGGGASYVKRYLHPKMLTGVDYARSAVRLARKLHPVAGLFFVVGDAERLPFPPDSFDAVVNVESCHAYAYQDNFFAEVVRVLRQNGHFLMTDFRSPVGLDDLRRSLYRTGLKILEEKNIARNVFLSLERENQQKLELIERLTPTELRKEFEEFAGTEGSTIYEGLKDGLTKYMRYVLQKP